ncbi:interleukin-1 receptor type 2 isoform X3 [Canis lupus familiaris]|uniref:interleukin-1 receptor type 2 isoform X3 n=1 Tax=Canis lupus dingo TaxID=286419 RepID=UPI0015F130D7|nr:interleukin-1 receptor type 2 isoform X3 [Canis lupus dingo]XP_038406858.1 interleukin-1 receptor type 2 isoform X3 [Canis lupus familiaris]XP_038500027.1 interleukin-1 receptor type 2 isoform X3 [Canis lupus familiaris]XP_038536140.1 interleukin-1 receptor type 2 isoform X3 [Canis lupus familiaris]
MENLFQDTLLQSAGSEISISRVLRKLPETMFILYMLIMGVSAFTIQPEEHPGAAENCQFRGKYFKTDFRVEGEPVVLRCPQVQPWLWTSVSPHTSLAWRKNDSARMVPGKEETRMWVQDGALWILPALQEDSGTYICTARNASYCDEMSVELRVFEKTEASLPFISYPQILTLSTSGFLVCPDLSEFTHNKMDMKIQWYKDSVLLDQDNEKFLNVKGTSRLLIHNVSVEDAGYYSCAVTFTHEGMLYNVSRNIELRVNSEYLLLRKRRGDNSCDYLPPPDHIGFTGEYSENNENYIEVPLIFDPVIREDLNTDFKCFVRNTLSFQMLHATVKEAASFSWGMVLAPLSLVILVLVGIIWMHRRCKHRSGKAYSWTMFKTGH